MNKCTEEKLMTRQNCSEYLRSKQVLKKKLKQESGNTHTLKRKKEKKKKNRWQTQIPIFPVSSLFLHNPSPPPRLATSRLRLSESDKVGKSYQKRTLRNSTHRPTNVLTWSKSHFGGNPVPRCYNRPWCNAVFESFIFRA